MSFFAPLIMGVKAGLAGGAGLSGSMAAASSLVGTGTAAGIGAGVGMGVGALAGSVGALAGSVGGLGGLTTLVGGVQQYRGQQSMAKAQADAANYNARMAELQGQQRAGLIRRQGQRQLSTIQANLAKSGATSAGTPLMVMAESAADVEIDAMNAMWSAQQESSLQRTSAINARRAGNVRAGTSLLTTASKLF